jgi:uncharacterized protein (DUF302 family)
VDIEGLITASSQAGPAETAERLVAAISARGLTVFARIDHSAGAAAAGLTLRPTQVVIFGNARGGTPLMQAEQLIGIDLPLRALVWQDAAQRTWVSSPDMTWLARRYGLPAGTAPAIANITAVLQGLVAQSTGAPAEDELDSELAQSFPASDPLPWSHDTK